jgi:protein-tyrosine phosphatase
VKKRQEDLKALEHLSPGAIAEKYLALAEPIQIPGLRYVEVKITGRAFELFLLRQTSWWGLLRVLFLLIIGFRMQAIAILGRAVMVPRGLKRLGLDSIDHSGPEISQVCKCCGVPAEGGEI